MARALGAGVLAAWSLLQVAGAAVTAWVLATAPLTHPAAAPLLGAIVVGGLLSGAGLADAAVGIYRWRF